MFYIDAIADGMYVFKPYSFDSEERAWAFLADAELSASVFSRDHEGLEVAARMYDDQDSILASSVYSDGVRIV